MNRRHLITLAKAVDDKNRHELCYHLVLKELQLATFSKEGKLAGWITPNRSCFRGVYVPETEYALGDVVVADNSLLLKNSHSELDDGWIKVLAGALEVDSFPTAAPPTLYWAATSEDLCLQGSAKLLFDKVQLLTDFMNSSGTFLLAGVYFVTLGISFSGVNILVCDAELSQLDGKSVIVSGSRATANGHANRENVLNYQFPIRVDGGKLQIRVSDDGNADAKLPKRLLAGSWITVQRA